MTRLTLVDITWISSVKSTYKGHISSSCPQMIWICTLKDVVFYRAQKELDIPTDPKTHTIIRGSWK